MYYVYALMLTQSISFQLEQAEAWKECSPNGFNHSVE